MKKSGTCPKCAGKDIRISRQRMWGTIIPVGSTVFGAAYSSLYICASCGFVESWVEQEKDLEKIRKRLGSR